jgi:hypothetical protein
MTFPEKCLFNLYTGIILLVAVLVAGCFHGSEKNTPALIETSSDSSSMSDLKFLTQRVAFKAVSSDTLLRAKYPFVNTGKKNLAIEQVLPDCTCTDYNLSNKNIPPGDTAFILLKYSTKGKFGESKAYVTIEANTPTRLYSLEIVVEIR